MEMLGTPLTRENYMNLATMGSGKELSPEEEADIPARFQKFSPTHEDLERDKQAKAKPAKGAKAEPAPAGAPVDWGGMIIPNTSGIKPELDTEHRTQPPKLGEGSTGYVDMNISNPVGKPQMNSGNTPGDLNQPPDVERHTLSPSGEMVPNEMPTREQ
jgi:hypothetical protein